MSRPNTNPNPSPIPNPTRALTLKNLFQYRHKHPDFNVFPNSHACQREFWFPECTAARDLKHAFLFLNPKNIQEKSMSPSEMFIGRTQRDLFQPITNHSS
eukprot:sb/3478772/